MKLCLFASYTYKRKSIRVFRTPILVYLDVRGVEIPLLSTVSISNCRYQEAPGEVVWSDFLAQLPRRSIEILWHLTRPSGLVKCQRISILLLGNCARISQTFGVNIQIFEYISAAAGPGWFGKYIKWRSGIKTRAWKHKYLFFKLLFELLTSFISTNYLQASININLVLQYWYVCKEKYL